MVEKLTASREDEAPRNLSPRAREKLEALRKLQASVKARGIDVEAWAREARAERFAASSKWMSVFDDQS